MILGGGPSLCDVDVSQLKGRGHTVAVNNSYLLAPFAEIVYFADRSWFRHHAAALAKHPAPFKVARADPIMRHDVKGLVVWEWNGKGTFSREWGKLCGLDSGSNALNLAYLLGAKRIVLFGFDMIPGKRWHGRHDHASEPRPEIYRERYVPGLNRMAVELAKDGVEVLNASGESSALECFKMISIEEALRLA